MSKTRAWSARYMQYRNARNKLELVRAQRRAGLDTSGLFPAEVERIALLTFWIKEYAFHLTAGYPANETDEELQIIATEIAADHADCLSHTDEFISRLHLLAADVKAISERPALPSGNN